MYTFHRHSEGADECDFLELLNPDSLQFLPPIIILRLIPNFIPLLTIRLMRLIWFVMPVLRSFAQGERLLQFRYWRMLLLRLLFPVLTRSSPEEEYCAS